MKAILFPVLNLICIGAFCQAKCDCPKEFEFVRSFIERNYAGYNDKVTDKKSFSEYTAIYEQQAAAAGNRTYCEAAIAGWLLYFQDDHIQMIDRQADAFDPATTFNIDSSQIKSLGEKTLKDIEGLYVAESNKYKIAIVKDQTPFRDYVGTILSSTNKSWTAGQVKIELKLRHDDIYDAIFYMGNHSVQVRQYTIRDGKFDPPDYQKAGLLNGTAQAAETEPFPKIENSNQIVAFRKISDSACYLRIKSFDDHFAKKIDEVLESNKKTIESTPYMILDLRYNGGGSDFTYSKLIPLVYTRPIKTIGVDVLSTPENIESWSRLERDNPKLPAAVKSALDSAIQKMKDNPNRLVKLVDDQTYTATQTLLYPKKIAILIDRDCGSSTEEFLLAAKQSDKVILFGENTAGVLDYSNMRTVDLECLKYALGYSTTRSRRIPEGAIDKNGIAADVKEDFKAGWLDRVLARLRN